MNEAGIRALIRDVPDFPEPGIVFKDITPLLSDAAALSDAVNGLLGPFSGEAITEVAGIEARGFILAAPAALRLGAGFVPLRKPGKLPYRTSRVEYQLEYGTDALEVHVDAFPPGARVLIVDDVLATGGTAAAAVRLIREQGADVVGVSVLIELGSLKGRERLSDVELFSGITYD